MIHLDKTKQIRCSIHYSASEKVMLSTLALVQLSALIIIANYDF